MRLASVQLIAAVLIFCTCAHAQSTTKPAAASIPAAFEHLQFDRNAALIEIVPPGTMQQSPAAPELINRLMRKHVLLLQHPLLVKQVIENPKITKAEWIMGDDPVGRVTKAIRIRMIPGTNIIEFSIDPALGNINTAELAEALDNHHLDNVNMISQNKSLERSVMLNNLKQRYQFR